MNWCDSCLNMFWTSSNLLENSDANWCNLLHLNMSRPVHRYMTKYYENWANRRRSSWRQSYSLDRFDERVVKYQNSKETSLNMFNHMIRIDTILQTSWNLSWISKTSDTNWCDSSNMSKHVSLIWIDTILQSCWNLSKSSCYVI